MGDFNFLHITSVADLPGYHAAAAFNTKRSEAFKETEEISPRMISDKVKYMPWGADDQMPFDIINYCCPVKLQITRITRIFLRASLSCNLRNLQLSDRNKSKTLVN